MVRNYFNKFYRRLIIKDIIEYLKDIYNHSYLLKVLIKRDIKQRFVGSAFGMLWAFIQPIMFIIIMWVVISGGFRTSLLSDDVPFILYLSTGIVAWNLFAETWLFGTNSIIEYSFVIKKTSFRSSLLPLIKIFSSFMLNIPVLFIVIVLLILHGYYPSLYWLQFFYYFLCILFLSLSLNFISASTNVFLLDIRQLVQIFIQFGLWLTPIFWKIDLLPDKYKLLVNLNPMYYVVNGYRETFIYGKWFWENPYTLYFWGFVLVVAFIGVKIFKSLRPYFTDVL